MGGDSPQSGNHPNAIPFGSYELLQCIAAGGMGEVFLARKLGAPASQKPIVVKVLLPHLVADKEFVHLFLNEARIAAQLNHPNIAQMYDLGQAEDSYYIAMEYVHGESVERIQQRALEQQRPVPLNVVARIVSEAALGLDFAHKATDADGRPLNVIHRDVSPQNVLAAFDGAVKIIDFGIAKASGVKSVTQAGVLRGKVSYMAPEQAAGHRIDHRIDVFALGILLFEMATNTRLFPYTNDIKTLVTVTRCEIPAPHLIDPRIDFRLETIILKALAREREARYQSAGELREALEGWLAEPGRAFGARNLAEYLKDLFRGRLEAEGKLGNFYEPEVKSKIFRPQPAPAPTPAAPPISSTQPLTVANSISGMTPALRDSQTVIQEAPSAPALSPGRTSRPPSPTSPSKPPRASKPPPAETRIGKPPDDPRAAGPSEETRIAPQPTGPRVSKGPTPFGALGARQSETTVPIPIPRLRRRTVLPRSALVAAVVLVGGAIGGSGVYLAVAGGPDPAKAPLRAAGADAAVRATAIEEIDAGEDAVAAPDAGADEDDDDVPDAGVRPPRPPRRISDYEAGTRALNKQKWDRATWYLKRAVDANPRNARAYYYLGYAYGKQGKTAEMIQAYEEFVHLSPKDPTAARLVDTLKQYYAKTKKRPKYKLP